MSDPFVFAVIADSHFHPEADDAQSAYASDRLHNARNRAVVEWIRRSRAELVIHLGDVPHPVPGLAAHRVALAVARDAYAPLGDRLHVVAGNHDVGDKPHPLSPAPGATEARQAVFMEHWGAAWRSFDHRGVHFVLLDTPVLNTGSPREAEQWAWLEADLAAASGRRTFVFVHYPPFLLDPAEPEHYDNLAEPGRGRLLALLARHRVEALFAGHVHHFFWHHLDGTDHYLLPSTAFMRPEYAELCPVEPGDEYGRNEAGRLGFCFVHVDATGHRIEPVRTGGATVATALPGPLAPGSGPTPPCPLAVTLRHRWDRVADLPSDSLDPFRRKEARNDLVVLALWDAGLTRLRLPVEDVERPGTRARLARLHARGARPVVYVAGVPSAGTWRSLVDAAGLVEAVELILPRGRDTLEVPPGAPPVWVSVAGGQKPKDDAYFSHFPAAGWAVDEPIEALAPGEGVVFRVLPDAPLFDTVARAVERARGLGRRPICQVWLPRAGEGAMADDDRAVAVRVAEAWAAARAFPEAWVGVDTFVDHDRGYYPRHGLLDRHGVPRPALVALRALARLAPEGVAVPDGPGRFRLPTGTLVLAGNAGEPLAEGPGMPRWIPA